MEVGPAGDQILGGETQIFHPRLHQQFKVDAHTSDRSPSPGTGDRQKIAK